MRKSKKIYLRVVFIMDISSAEVTYHVITPTGARGGYRPQRHAIYIYFLDLLYITIHQYDNNNNKLYFNNLEFVKENTQGKL